MPIPKGPIGSITHLTLPLIAPPLPDIDGISCNWTGLEAVRPLAHDREICRAEEHDERELRQVNLMDQLEEHLPRAWIRRRLFLLVEGIQRMVAVEVPVGASAIRRDLVAC